jgi:hypothetical protein
MDSPATGCPQAGQNRAPIGIGAAQRLHVAESSAPQLAQNRAPSGFSAAQEAQSTLIG